MILQKSSVELWWEDMFRIDVQGNENNVQIKTIQNRCTEDENNI